MAEALVETEPTTAAPAAPVGGLAEMLGTADHLAVGRLYIVVSLLLLVLGRVANVLIGAEGLDTGGRYLDDIATQVFSLSLTADAFLFLLPAFLGLAIAIVPLQVGAATVAFPRAAAASFWGWLLSSGVLLSAYFIDGGPVGADPDGVLLWVIGLGGALVSLSLASVCVATTVLALRTGGMGVDRVPFFAWTSLVAAVVWLLSLPVLLGVLVVTYVDTRYTEGQIGAAAGVDWAFGAPAIFGFALPTLGLLLDAAPMAAGERLRNRGTLLGAVALAGLLGFGADTISGGGDPAIFQDVLYVAACTAGALPLLAVLGGVADVLRRGRPTVTAPLLAGTLGLLLLLAAAVANAVRVVDVLDLTGTSADVGVTQLAVLGGALGVLGGVAQWSSKLFGTRLPEGPARGAALVLFLGGVVVGLPLVIAGLLDQPVGFGVTGDFEPLEDLGTIEALNGLSAGGGALVLLGVLLVIVTVATGQGADDDEEIPADPWGSGQTLEWLTASPPVPGGIGPIEAVGSAAPLLDAKEGAA